MMSKRYWFVERRNNGVEDVVYAAGFHASSFCDEVLKWFKYSEFKDGRWIERSKEDQQKRLNMVESVIGSKTVDLLLHCRDYKIEHMWTIVGIVFERLNRYINSEEFGDESELEKELEDLCFYCGEILRGIESAFQLVETVDADEECIKEYLTDSIGCVFKDREDRESEKLSVYISDYLHGAQSLEDVIEQLNKVRKIRDIKFGYEDEE
jgi:hypothetical protein